MIPGKMIMSNDNHSISHRPLSERWDLSVDVLVIGSGKGALTAALCCNEMGGGDVLVVEKGPLIGGTSALSGGVIWIPCNRYGLAAGATDSLAEAHDYLRRTIPDDVRRDEMIEAYLANGPKMIDFLHQHSHARYISLSTYPDYHSHIPGARLGDRALEPAPLDSALLGAANRLVSHSHRLWYLLGVIPMTLTEIKAIQTKQPGSQKMILGMLARYVFDLPWRLRSRFDRYRKVGGAGVGRLFLSLQERAVPMWRNAPMRELVMEDGRAIGALIERDGKLMRIRARKAVMLAAGGFEHDQAMRERFLPQPTSTTWSAAVGTNTGDAIRAGMQAGADTALMGKAWWCMTIKVPGEERPRLMIIEKALPGCCLVNAKGQRFLNESQNYQTLVDRLYQAHTDASPCAPAYLVFDARFRSRYLVGPLLNSSMRPDWTLPKRWYDEGMLNKADSLDALAAHTGIDPVGLRDTIVRLNQYAASGEDLDFGRGNTAYDRHYGDPEVKPNPNLAPIVKPPFYALKLFPGDIGTQGGLVTNTHGQVLRADGEPIAGLYASGNCTAAIMPTYPGPGATLGPAMVFAYQAAKHINGFHD
jgi:3-oxosteroid 1-dehydrogenase